MPANERDERLARALFADVQVLSNIKIPCPIEYNSSVFIVHKYRVFQKRRQK